MWTPLVRSQPTRGGVLVDIKDEEYWENDEYQVHVRTISSERDDVPDMKHLSICRTDKQAVHDWRAFQRIKNELCGPEWEGVEIYPAESRLVDAANQYHLWCFQFTLGFGFGTRMVASPAQVEIVSPASTQREFEKVDLTHGGLTKLKDLREMLNSVGRDGYGKPVDEAQGGPA